MGWAFRHAARCLERLSGVTTRKPAVEWPNVEGSNGWYKKASLGKVLNTGDVNIVLVLEGKVGYVFIATDVFCLSWEVGKRWFVQCCWRGVGGLVVVRRVLGRWIRTSEKSLDKLMDRESWFGYVRRSFPVYAD